MLLLLDGLALLTLQHETQAVTAGGDMGEGKPIFALAAVCHHGIEQGLIHLVGVTHMVKVHHQQARGAHELRTA